MHGVLGRAKKVYGLPANAAADVEKFPVEATGEIQMFFTCRRPGAGTPTL